MTTIYSTWPLERRLDAIAGDVEKTAYYLIRQEDEEEWSGVGEVSLNVYALADFCESCVDLIHPLIERARTWNAETNEWESPGTQVACDSSESDSSRYCHWCGEKLETIMSDYCAVEEMRHYSQHPPAIPLRPADAADLSNILASGSASGSFIAKVKLWLYLHDRETKQQPEHAA